MSQKKKTSITDPKILEAWERLDRLEESREKWISQKQNLEKLISDEKNLTQKGKKDLSIVLRVMKNRIAEIESEILSVITIIKRIQRKLNPFDFLSEIREEIGFGIIEEQPVKELE